MGEGGEQMIVDRADIRTVPGERNPAERADSLAKQRPQKRLGEHRNVEGPGDAGAHRLTANQVAVVEHDGARAP